MCTAHNIKSFSLLVDDYVVLLMGVKSDEGLSMSHGPMVVLGQRELKYKRDDQRVLK